MELSIPYAFSAVDGSRFVVGNSDAAKADPDWIGTLDPEAGITGLLDGAEVRPGASLALPQGDGSILGPSYVGGRSGAVQGKLDPNVAVATREAYEQKVRTALYAMRAADGLLTWTPSAIGALPRMLRVRAVGRPDFRGRHPKTFMLTLASPDPYVLSRDEASLTLGPLNGATNVGTGGSTGHVGDGYAWPRFYLDGPINTPTLYQYNNPGYQGQFVTLSQNIGATQRLIYLPERNLAILGAKIIEQGFENSALGWSVAAAWGVNAGTSINRVTAAGKWHSGAAGGEVVVPAVAFSGVRTVDIPGPFIKGRTYTVRLWQRSATHTTPVQVIVVGEADSAGSNALALAAGYVEHVAVWTPTRTHPNCLVAARTTTATATTWQIDDLSIKENGKAYDYVWGVTSPIDVSGVIQAGRRILLEPGPNGEYIITAVSTGAESYARMIFNHAYV